MLQRFRGVISLKHDIQSVSVGDAGQMIQESCAVQRMTFFGEGAQFIEII